MGWRCKRKLWVQVVSVNAGLESREIISDPCFISCQWSAGRVISMATGMSFTVKHANGIYTVKVLKNKLGVRGIVNHLRWMPCAERGNR